MTTESKNFQNAGKNVTIILKKSSLVRLTLSGKGNTSKRVNFEQNALHNSREKCHRESARDVVRLIIT